MGFPEATANISSVIPKAARVTYLGRMLPFVIFRKKIKSRFVKDFLYYVPYAVLGAMTIPAAFYSTGSIASAAAGVGAAVLLAFKFFHILREIAVESYA